MYKDSLGFHHAGDAYEASRPDYPREAIDTICRVSRLEPNALCLDVASGTGKLARELRSQRLRVLALDQAWPMLLTLKRVAPTIASVGGRAEAIPFTEESFDITTIGQAFQWFSSSEALRELFRVLKKGGYLWLIWNKRDTSQEWVQAIEAIARNYRRDAPHWMNKDWKIYIDELSIFSPVQAKKIEWERRLDIETLLKTVMSRSYISLLPANQKQVVLSEIRVKIEEYTQGSQEATLNMRYETSLFWCRK